jgi:hypothetical protein
MSQNSPSVFLSHSHADKQFARQLAEDLQGAGARVWIDEAEIRLGDSLIKKISAAIDEVDYLAVVLSPASVESEWVRREVEIALNEEIAGQAVKVLPLLLSTCEIPAFLRGRLYADFTGPDSYPNAVNLILERLGLYRESRPRKAHPAAPTGGALLREQERRQVQIEELASVWHRLAPGLVVNKTGLRSIGRLLSTFSPEEILYGMEQAADSYLVQADDESVTPESWEIAFGKIGGICRVQRESKGNPELRELYYIRGIIKKRLSYVDQVLALQLLRDSYAAGADTETLRGIAYQASSWTRWREDMYALLEERSQDAR